MITGCYECLQGLRKMLERKDLVCMNGAKKLSGRFPEGFYEVFEGCLEVVDF